MIDSHCHMYDEAYKEDFISVYNRSKEKGVNKLIMVGCSESSNSDVLELQKTYDNIYATVGVHPTYVNQTGEDYFNKLEDIIKNNIVYAIGECGLDYYWTQDNKERQKNYFIKQIELSIKYNLPLIIHCRDAVQDMYDILKQYEGKIKFVMHGYSGSVEMAQRFVQLGAYLGIGGVVTFKNAKNVKETVDKIDIKHLLLETDCPYLTPTPFRGKRNEPSYLELIALEIANIKQITLNEVMVKTVENTEELFKLEKCN